uniref:SFRICE_012561 n=1 Tax=Spodoptera frugiperda TaxID=7108 RepID=A0A2H1VLE8_SPOFR
MFAGESMFISYVASACELNCSCRPLNGLPERGSISKQELEQMTLLQTLEVHCLRTARNDSSPPDHNQTRANGASHSARASKSHQIITDRAQGKIIQSLIPLCATTTAFGTRTPVMSLLPYTEQNSRLGGIIPPTNSQKPKEAHVNNKKYDQRIVKQSKQWALSTLNLLLNQRLTTAQRNSHRLLAVVVALQGK